MAPKIEPFTQNDIKLEGSGVLSKMSEFDNQNMKIAYLLESKKQLRISYEQELTKQDEYIRERMVKYLQRFLTKFKHDLRDQFNSIFLEFASLQKTEKES